MELTNKMNGVLDSLDIDAKCVNAQRNGHLAFFDVKLGNSTRVRNLELFSREIALGLRSIKEPIITPIHKKGVVRLRVAMDNAESVDFNELCENNSQAPEGMLPFLIGKTDKGEPLWLDMATNPHMLVAGSTGSGKSVLLHVLARNALRRDDVDLMLIDPKFGVEFGQYEGRAEVARDYDEAILFLQGLQETMNSRYKMMAKMNVSTIEKWPSLFNKKLLIIDEVADLMMQQDKNKEFEELLCSIAQKARACGIYMVIATQRPSVDVVTGKIKANFPARIACRVSEPVDSKVILGKQGAESLLGRGDAIIKNARGEEVRFQVAYVDPATN